jgi:poly(3-hydroxyalkanoate) depolymerase
VSQFGEECYVATGGQRIRVNVRWGSGVPLVLCNGIGASLEVLDPLVEQLDPDTTVVRFDVPGTGGSPTSLAPYGFPYLSWVLGRVLTELGIGVVDVLGLSWGGALAQQFAFQQASRCRRLVLAATSPGHLMVPGRLSVLLKMATPRRYKDADYMRRIAGDIYGGAMRRSPELVREHLRHVRWSSDFGYYLQLAAGFGWTSLPWLRFLPQPTLVLAGTDDPIVPLVNARILARLIPDARLVTIDDGHLFLVTSATESAEIIADFLN